MKMIRMVHQLGKVVLVAAVIDVKSHEHPRTNGFPYSFADFSVRVQSSFSVIATQILDLLLDLRGIFPAKRGQISRIALSATYIVRTE